MLKNMIRIENVTKTYRKGENIVKALDKISISAIKGEFVVVKGSSGCGKTTLLLAAGGLLHPQEGEIIVNNQDIYKLSPENRARFRASNIGFVFQQYHLIPYLSVLENVNVPSLANNSEMPSERAVELIEELGLKERMHHTPAELSAGEKQRTALARALLYNPKIILADEITGNLDHVNASIVLNKLKDYTKSGGTVLLVTHDEKAFEYADRIIEMKNGSTN
jgi:ABC-type lipoprotein export system ATPase subunit